MNQVHTQQTQHLALLGTFDITPITAQSSHVKANSDNSFIAKPTDLSQSNSTTFSHWIMTNDSLCESFELIKILRSHQHSGRWTVLIAPQNIPDKALLSCCSVDMDRVLVVHVKQNTNIVATIENALTQSTCSAVVTWCDQLTTEKLKQLSHLAQNANSHLYAISRSHKWAA